jgi:hypothetical protein
MDDISLLIQMCDKVLWKNTHKYFNNIFTCIYVNKEETRVVQLLG